MLSLFIILISLRPSQDFGVMQGHLEFSAPDWPLKVVARVVPKCVIPWSCFTARFSVSYVLPLLTVWLISASYIHV